MADITFDKIKKALEFLKEREPDELMQSFMCWRCRKDLKNFEGYSKHMMAHYEEDIND